MSYQNISVQFLPKAEISSFKIQKMTNCNKKKKNYENKSSPKEKYYFTLFHLFKNYIYSNYDKNICNHLSEPKCFGLGFGFGKN